MNKYSIFDPYSELGFIDKIYFILKNKKGVDKNIETYSQFYSEANKAMYQAKRSREDRIAVSNVPQATKT